MYSDPTQIFYNLGSAAVAVIPFLFLTSLLGIAAAVMLGLTVYTDAKIRRNDNPVLWGVLSGFFRIVAIIYLIVMAVTKPKTLYCNRCGNIVPQNMTNCPVCGNPVALGSEIMTPEKVASLKKRRTVFLILFIVFYALVFVCAATLTVVLTGGLLRGYAAIL